MANPFLIQPAQYGQQIAGVADLVGQYGEQKRMKDQKVKAQEIQKSFTDAYRSGDYDKIAELSISNPEIGNRVFEAMGTAEEASKGRMIRDAWSMVNDPSKAESVLQQRIADSQSQGVPADQSIKELEFLRSNPDGYTEKYIKPVLASIDPKGWTDYKKALIAGEPEAITPYQQAQLDMQEKTFVASRSDAAFNRQMKKLDYDLKVAEKRAKAAKGTAKEQEAQIKLEEAKKKSDTAKFEDQQKIETGIYTAQQNKDAISTMLGNDDYMDSVTGYSGRMPTVTTSGVEAEAYLDNIKNSMTIDNLGVMSGPLTDKDIQIIASASSRLRPGMSKHQLEKELKTIDKTYDRVIKNYQKEANQKGYSIGGDSVTETTVSWGDL